MNYEIKFVCAFILSIMVFSSFTPFAYAIKEPTTLEFSRQTQVSQSCSNDVWLDELDWSEVQKLREQTVNMIDGIGNKDVAAQEAAAEEAGMGTNPEAVTSEDIFIPGVDGEPALLYDVMKNRALEPDNVCHLNNLFSSGRVAYVTRLSDNVRYCADAAAEPCERSITSKQAEEMFNTVNKLNTESQSGENGETGLTDEYIASREAVFNALKEALPSPTSKIVTSDAKITINSDTNIFFMKTAAEFLNFVAMLAPWDVFIGAVNMVALGRALPVMGSQVKGILGFVKMKGIYVSELLRGAGGGANWLKAGRMAGKAEAMVKAVEVADEATKAGKGSFSLLNDVGKMARAEAGDAVDGAIKATQGNLARLSEGSTNIRLVDQAGNVLGSTEDIAKLSPVLTPGTTAAGETMGMYETTQKLATETAKQNKVLDVVKTGVEARTTIGINKLGAEGQELLIRTLAENGQTIALGASPAAIKNAVTAFAKLRGGKDAVLAQLDMAKAINGWRLARNQLLAIDTLEVTTDTARIAAKLAGEAQDGIKAANSIEAVKRGISSATEIGLLKSQQEFGALGALGKLEYAIKAAFGAPWAKRLLLWTQWQQTAIMGTLFLRNVALAYPTFSAQGIIEFDLNNELANYATTKSDELHFIDVKKTSGIPGGARFLASSLDRFLTSVAGTGEELEARELATKIQRIQDIVFILDEDALLPATSNVNGVNLITPLDSDGWRFFSKSPASTLVYNFEHPSGYAPAGKSALLLSLRNINVYGISGIPNEFFHVPLIDDLTSTMRPMRDLTGMLALFAAVPAMFRLFPIGGGVVGIIASAGMAYFGLKTTIDSRNEIFSGDIVDVTQPIDEKQLCKNRFGLTEEVGIVALKSIRTAMALCSAKAAPVLMGPLFWIGLLCDAAQFAASYAEIEVINGIDENLRTCAETNYEVLSVKEIKDPQQLQDEVSEVLKPLKAEALNIFSILSPESGKQLDAFSQNMDMQTLNMQVHADDILANVEGTELYYVHFKDADIKWFQGPTCNIDLCSREGAAFKCIRQNGYLLLDRNGDPIINGAPQAASLRMNMNEGYMSIVQKAINIKKGSGDVLEIYPNPYKVSIKNNCLSQTIVNLTAMGGYSAEYQQTAITNLFGEMDAIYTPDAEIWIDGNDIAVHFFKETKISDEVTFGAGEIFRFTNSHIRFYRDAGGTVEIVDNANKVTTKFELGREGAIGFSNALIRSGFAQEASEKGKAADYSDVYHVFIYSLVSADMSEINKYSINSCMLPDGTFGIRPVVSMDDLQQENQWNTILNGMCMADVLGSGNSSLHFNGSVVTVIDPTGAYKKYKILGYDQTCGLGAGGYRVEDADGVESCLFMEKGPDGRPQFMVDAQAPIPLMWATGMGGSFMYDPNSGRISIKNEFPFALNPNFALYGAGGLGMMTPTLPPWGGTAKTTGVGGGGPTNILAALPWTPNGLELALFIIALAGGLLFVRIRYRRTS